MDINIGSIISAGSKRSRKNAGTVGLPDTDAGKAVELKKLEEAELIEMVKSAKSEWLDANMSFEHVYDEELVDYYTYKMKACESRYAFYLRKAKEQGIKAELLESAETGSSLNNLR